MESGLRAILDSDVLIDFLQGQTQAEQELRRYPDWEISVVSWMEVLSGAEGPEEEKACRRFLDSLKVHFLSAGVAEEAVRLRKKFPIRLPDAIIWATARTEGCLLVTRNHRRFPKDEPDIRIPYDLG